MIFVKFFLKHGKHRCFCEHHFDNMDEFYRCSDLGQKGGSVRDGPLEGNVIKQKKTHIKVAFPQV